MFNLFNILVINVNSVSLHILEFHVKVIVKHSNEKDLHIIT